MSQPCDETDDLFVRYRATGSRALRNELVLRHRWLAERCANRFRNRGEPVGDIEQVALLGLVKAVERFDPERGMQFATFANPTITGEIKRHFRDHTWAVHVPRRSKDLMVGVRTATDELHQRLGRSPTVDEVAAEIGSSREAVLETMEASAVYRSSSLDRPARPTERAETMPVGESFGLDDVDLADADVRVVARNAMATLDRTGRQVLYWRFYEQCTQEEIGRRLDMGQVQVSRLLRSLLAQLRGELGPEPDHVDATHR